MKPRAKKDGDMKKNEEMVVYASYKSVNIPSYGIKIFRYNTEFRSICGQGKPIGLVVMLNPGCARPDEDDVFSKLQTEEFETNGLVLTRSDKTMDRVKKLIRILYETNNKVPPKQFTVHIENLFNLREKDSDKAKKLVRNIRDHNDLMFKPRVLEKKYDFVFFAWGNTDVNDDLQCTLLKRYPNAISVHTWHGEEVTFPVHPSRMNFENFEKAAKGKLKK